MTRKHHSSSSAATVRKQKMVEEEDEDEDEDEEEEEEEDDEGEGEDEDDYNYADASESQGDEYQHSEKEAEEEEEEEEEDDGSKSMSNEQSQSYVPEKKSPSISPSDFHDNPSQQPILNYASSSYMKIAPLPIFHGTPNECPITHLSRFNKVCRANNASSIEMQMRIFPVTLEEEAALWYDLNIEPYYSNLSWDEIKCSFLQAYYKFEPFEELRSELMGIHQGEKESVRSYFLRLQWILKRWPEHGFHENVVKGVFVDGLRQEFHDWVLMQKPNSLNDALKLAFGFEQMRSIRGTKEKEEGKGLLRSFSMGESSRRRQGKIERDEGEESMKKNQCQCTKHQCGIKKNLLRNSSLESRISPNH